MEVLAQVLIEGAFTGMTIALIAMSVSLTWGVMYIVNFAQGELMMLGMFLSYYFAQISGLDPLLSIPLVAIVMYFVGTTIYKTLIRQVMKASTLSQLLCTYALSIVLVNVAQNIFGASFKTITTQRFVGSIQIGDLLIALPKLIPFLVGILVAAALYIIVNKTQTGCAIKATALNRDAAALCGIDAEKAFTICMGLASAVSGVAGVSLSYYFYVYPNVGSVFMNFGFVACCIGGMGSIPGAVLGGLMMGLIDSIVGTYFNVAFKYLAMFGLFIFVVYKRPKGLFGW